MKVLVTGATGFVGNNLIKNLMKYENIKIVATSRDCKKASKLNWFPMIRYISYDMNSKDKINLFDYFEEPDRMIHLAWEGLPNYEDSIHIKNNLPNNLRFIKNLISNGLKEISVTGTCFEYGMVDGCMNENMKANPSNSYSIAKDSLRKSIVDLKNKFDFNYKWIRLFYMYGEGQNKNSLIALLDEAIKNGEKEFNMSGGEQLRDYLHSDEVVKNITKIALQNKIDNQIINCCSGKSISVKKLVENYLNEKNYEMKLNLGYYPYPAYEPMSFWGDNSKLKELSCE